jgi:serine protease Do
MQSMINKNKQMKRYLHVILAGLIGGVVAIAGYKWVDSQPFLASEPFEPKAVFTSYNASPSINVPGDFVESARKSTGSVVHIYAEESDELAMQKRRSQRRNDPLFNFFGFEDFFGGGNFYTPKNGTGSGVIYSESGYVITNNHVVGFADRITVTDAEGKKYQATKVGTDAATDLAVLKIEGGKGFVPVKLGDSDKVQVGEWVLAVGNPFGYLTSTVTAGIVSAKGRSLNLIQNEKAIEEFIQTDAAINPGNSGGALVNLQGELIGINTAIATPTGVFAGYSFAIPAKIVKKVVTSIIENGGKVERTNLGVAGYDVNAELIDEYGLKLREKRGFYIEEVDKRSPAQMGGILPGDVIIEIDGKAVKNYEDIERAMKYNIVGDKLSVKVNRGGREMDIPIALRKSF